MTGWGRPEDRQKALDAGFDLHLTKPVENEDLKAALIRVAGLRRQKPRVGPKLSAR